MAADDAAAAAAGGQVVPADSVPSSRPSTRCRTPARDDAHAVRAGTWWLAGAGASKKELWAVLEEAREDITGMVVEGADPEVIAAARARYRELEGEWVALTMDEGGGAAAAAKPSNAVLESTSPALALVHSPQARQRAVAEDPFAAEKLKRRPFSAKDISAQPVALARPMASVVSLHRDIFRTLPVSDAELKRLYNRLTQGGTVVFTFRQFLALLRDLDPCGDEDFSEAQRARWGKAQGIEDDLPLSCPQFCALALKFHTCY